MRPRYYLLCGLVTYTSLFTYYVVNHGLIGLAIVTLASLNIILLLLNMDGTNE